MVKNNSKAEQKPFRTVMMPNYMMGFSCIGSDCEDTCCVGWGVQIDKWTYEKYKKIKDENIKGLVKQSIDLINKNQTSSNFASVKMIKGSCPFLNDEKLCLIQLNFGESYLSAVCGMFPRMINIVDGNFEKSATMSCPEAARLALLKPDYMEFFETQEQPQSGPIAYSKKVLTQNPEKRLNKYFWPLRIFTIRVLQERQYTLPERLIILGLFFQKLQQYIDANQLDSIPKLIDSYNGIIDGGDLRKDLAEIPVQFQIQIRLLRELGDQRILKGNISPIYKECYFEFLEGICFTGVEEEMVRIYQEAYKNHYSPFMENHSYILENYLVNYVFGNLFPCGNQASFFKEYCMLIIHYSLIKMTLIGMSAFHKGINEDLVIKLIHSFTKTVDHDTQFLDHMMDFLEKNNYNTMAFMAIVINN